MKQIRRNIFETNSSSSHAISILKEGRFNNREDLTKDMYISKDGVWSLWGEEMDFGRSPFMALTTFGEKFCYAVASFGKERIGELESIVFDLIPAIKKIDYPTERDDEGNVVPYYGYVDHQSMGLLEDFLNTNGVSLRDFLTDSRYVVFVDGDEYSIAQKMFRAGVLNADSFEMPEGKKYSDYDDPGKALPMFYGGFC